MQTQRIWKNKMENPIEFWNSMDEKTVRHLEFVHELNLFPQQNKKRNEAKRSKKRIYYDVDVLMFVRWIYLIWF